MLLLTFPFHTTFHHRLSQIIQNLQGLAIIYKDNAFVLVMWSRQPQSFCKYGSLWLCTIPIVNTNNKMRNQAVFYHIFVSICVSNICQTHHTEYHLLPSLILSLIGLGQKNKYTVFDRYLSWTHETVMNGSMVLERENVYIT